MAKTVRLARAEWDQLAAVAKVAPGGSINDVMRAAVAVLFENDLAVAQVRRRLQRAARRTEMVRRPFVRRPEVNDE